jgi:hypothetical protein
LRLSPSDGPIDYASPPLLYAAASASRDATFAHIELGNTDDEHSDFWPDKLPKDGKYPKVRIGIRAVDLAGNMSPPSEAVLQ